MRLIKPAEVAEDNNKQNDNSDLENTENGENPDSTGVKDSEFLADTVDALDEVGEATAQQQQVLSETIVCARWFDSKFIASNWHSIALTIRNTDNVVDIAIDGTGKMRSMTTEVIVTDDKEGLVLAWLPENLKTVPLDNESIVAVSGEEQEVEQPNIKMIYRVGSDSFCGIIKTVSISTHLDREDVWEMTKCYSIAVEEDRLYAQEIAFKKLMKEKAERGELEPIGNLIVNLKRCSDLVCADTAKGSGSSDPFVIMTVAKTSIESKRLQNDLNPVYNEIHEIPWDGISPLFIQIYDDDISKSDDPLGDLILPVGDFDFVTKKILKIEDRPLDHTSKGKISLDVSFKRKWIPIGMLNIKLISCIDLINMDFAEGSGVSDPYVIFSCGPNKVNSKHISNSLNPEFDEWLQIEWNGWEPLTIQVFDEDFGKADDFEGSIEIILTDFDFSNNNIMVIRDKKLSGLNNPKLDTQNGKINLDIKFNQTRWLTHIPSVKNLTPDGYIRYKEVPVPLICGSAEIDDIVIPDDIPAGDYFIDITDGVMKECIYSTANIHAIKNKKENTTEEATTGTNAIDLGDLNPSDVQNMHMIVEPIQPFKIPIKIVDPYQT